YLDWINDKVKLQLKAKVYSENKNRDNKHLHPLKPRRGDIYLAEMGQNIGSEINKQHLVLIMQNDKGNMYGDTVVIIPISSSGNLYKTHQKIEEKDIKSGKLNKLPSKAKTEQIHYLDKARLIHKVAILEDECMNNICNRLKKNLCL
ncbi:MAG: type II toxin-antitoxin system PemK/MazF family toxin, partial [Clostridia bacterium]